MGARPALTIRRLRAADAQAFQQLRLEGFAREPRGFRYAPEDEAHVTPAEVEARLERDFVVGAFCGETLVGIAGLSRYSGAKLRHKGLLWGMYVGADFRGAGVADRLMAEITADARRDLEIVTLSAMSDNARAIAFYRRWGFEAYGREPASVKFDGEFLDETLMSVRIR